MSSAESTPPAPMPPTRSPRSEESNWDIARRQFARQRPAVIGLAVIGFLFATALLAPFLADGKPLLMRIGGHWQSPVLRAFFAPTSFDPDAPGINAFFNAALLVVVIAAVGGLPLWRIVRRRFDDPVARARVRALSVLGLALAVGATGVLLLQNRAGSMAHDYRADSLRRTAGDLYFFPPVPFHPSDYDTAHALAGGTRRHPLGTDQLGRDVLARIIHGARISLSIGFVSVSIALLIGVTLGATAGYFGRWIDPLILRFIEVTMCFPVLFLILTLIAVMRRTSIFAIMLVIGVTSWTGVARLVRAEFLRQRGMEYVAAARALGLPAARLIFVHVLPNAIQPALVSATFGVAAAILYESTLSFLGLGVPPPVPSWGEMIRQASEHVLSTPQLALWPGLAIFLTVVSYNLVGEGLRDALDPRLRQ